MSAKNKFRAWDKDENKWYAPLHEAYAGRLHTLMLGLGGDLLAHTIKGVEHESVWPDKYVVVQSTGLKDKNGAELYFDCDLCELDEHDGLWYATKDDFGIPCWIPEHGGFGVHIEFSTYFLNGTRRKDAFKIHGNRFENPELLS